MLLFLNSLCRKNNSLNKSTTLLGFFLIKFLKQAKLLFQLTIFSLFYAVELELLNSVLIWMYNLKITQIVNMCVETTADSFGSSSAPSSEQMVKIVFKIQIILNIYIIIIIAMSRSSSETIDGHSERELFLQLLSSSRYFLNQRQQVLSSMALSTET